jgi:hypothetical protein
MKKPRDDAPEAPAEDPMELARRVMKRLVETPHKPHEPLAGKHKARPASKGRVHKGKSRA